ncbi:MAG: peptide ABC transporter substrate-binding protein [Cellulosilyticum sp.]|nr:peptide ABC transporter substrate-binding protein [Cellulosilyticum sp.]
MKKLKKLMLLSLLVLGVTGCGLWAQNDKESQPNDNINQIEETGQEENEKDKEQAPVENKLVLAMNTTTTLNPLYNTQANVEQALYLIFSPLINIEEDGSISENLAQSWVVSPDQTVVTITLKQGLTWHDGQPVTSDDVIFTLNQIAKIPDCPYKQATENIQTMERIDDTTFKIVYRQSFSGVLQTLFFPVIPQHIYDVENNSSMDITPIGCGPYMYDSITPLKALYLKANPNYFNGKPNIETVQINFIPDEVSGLYSFKQGLIDMVYTNETEWGKYTNSSSREPYEMVSSIYEFMGVNFNKPIFQSAAIRNALIYALDREEIVKLYYLEHAVITDTPISPESYLYNKNLETKQYDKEKARYLLAEQGYELDEKTGYMTKDGRIFSFTVMVNEENTDRIKVANAMQRMYADVGIDMQIEKVDKETYFSRLASKQFEAFLGGWQLSYALDLSFAFHSSSILSGDNYVSYRDEKMDELLQQAFTATAENVTEAYNALQEYFVEMSPYISLYFKKSVLMMKDTIGGNIEATPRNIFANVEEWTIS